LGRTGAIRRRSARPAPTLLPIKELEPRDVAAWRELAARAAEPNPFFEPECVLPAARHLGASDIGLLVVKNGDRDWLACMPVIPRLRRWHARLPVLAAWRNLYGCLGTPLVTRSAVEVATERLLAQALRASTFGVVAFPWLGDDGPVVAGLLSALEASGREPALHRSFERAMMRRTTLADGVDAVITSRHRRDLGRLARRLAEKLEAPLEVRDESERAAAVEDFMALEASGWKGEDGTALRSRPAHAEYFRELCDGFRAAGRLQLLALGPAEQTVSYKCNLLAGDAVFCFKIAHDESFAHYRPGLQLELRMLELFRDEMSETWMDSCAGTDSRLFEHFWPERRPIGSYIVAADGAVGWTINHSVAALHGLHGS
jgi:CelD/BcsL family acetyltransferase involved in cellulose biosynthesis